MQLAHRLGEVAGKHVRQHAEGKIDAGVELLLLGARRAAQDEVGDQFGVTRVADAKPQAVEVVLVAELRDDVAQAVVPTMATAALELGDARGQVEFVMCHQDRFRLDAEEIGQGRHGLAATVHVGGGDEQTNVVALMAELSRQAEIFAVSGQRDALGAGNAFNEKSPCVMPGLFVFGAGVTQADDQLDGGHVRGSSLELVGYRARGTVTRSTPAREWITRQRLLLLEQRVERERWQQLCHHRGPELRTLRLSELSGPTGG